MRYETGKYRVGTSYRRNVEHLAKEESLDASNKKLWKRSKKDWRHHLGRRIGCSGCSYCIKFESYRITSFRMQIRNFIKMGKYDEAKWGFKYSPDYRNCPDW